METRLNVERASLSDLGQTCPNAGSFLLIPSIMVVRVFLSTGGTTYQLIKPCHVAYPIVTAHGYFGKFLYSIRGPSAGLQFFRFEEDNCLHGLGHVACLFRLSARCPYFLPTCPVDKSGPRPCFGKD